MSRRRLPRRFPLVAAAFALVFAGAGDAQTPDPATHERQTGISTMIGAPNAQACSQYAAAGEASDEAVAACGRAIGVERLGRINQIATLINRGAIHLRRHDGEAALADFDAAIALDEDHAEAHLNRGAALIMVARPGQAVSAITLALSLGVREPHKAYYNRGAAREALGDLRGAYEDYSTALEIEPDWGPANAELARFVRMRRERLATILNGGTP